MAETKDKLAVRVYGVVSQLLKLSCFFRQSQLRPKPKPGPAQSQIKQIIPNTVTVIEYSLQGLNYVQGSKQDNARLIK